MRAPHLTAGAGGEGRGPPEKDTMRCTGSLQSMNRAGVCAGSLESALSIRRAWLKVSGSCSKNKSVIIHIHLHASPPRILAKAKGKLRFTMSFSLITLHNVVFSFFLFIS